MKKIKLFEDWKTIYKVIFGILVVGFVIKTTAPTILTISRVGIDGNMQRLLGGLVGDILYTVIIYLIVNWLLVKKGY